MEIDKKYLEEKLKLTTDAINQARDQVTKWDAIAKQNEGALNALNLMLKDLEKKADDKKQIEK